MSQPLNLAVRRYLLRKNLISLPFELLGAVAALVAAKELSVALLYYCASFLAGSSMGRRVASASSLLNDFTAKEIKDFQISQPLLTNVFLLAVPSAVAVATWRAGLASNQIVRWTGVGLSAALLAYRYFALANERRIAERHAGVQEAAE
ncbi:hypothetical protein [Sphingomonas sp.]|uniref:hypothetical protein n=1 Tax=Sphingomonas sp. TaxID=28214 RepID=UPI0025D9FC8F|nr:hypothetical protein [Sphingomonas sp.]